MDFLKKHADTAVVLTAIVSSLVWMNGKFNSIDHQMMEVDKQIAIIKTVLIMKNIFPADLAEKGERNE